MRVDLGELDHVSVRVQQCPGSTLCSWLFEVLGGPPQGVRTTLRRQLRAALPGPAARLLQTLFTPVDTAFPTPLAPALTSDSCDIADQVERIRGLAPDAVSAAVTEVFGEEVPVHWRPVLDAPRRYSTAFAEVFTALWAAGGHLWARTRDLRERHTEQIGVAAVTGALDVALDRCFSGGWRLSGNVLCRSGCVDEELALGDRHLVLAPMASGTSAGVFDFLPGALVVGYPVPGLQRAMTSVEGSVSHHDPLSIVLGQARAAILRRSAQRPTMGDLAHRMHYSAATITYHCRRLQGAGLITRKRHGQQIQLRLTPRGEGLLDLLN